LITLLKREGVETCQGWRQENLGVRSKKTEQDRQNAAGAG